MKDVIHSIKVPAKYARHARHYVEAYMRGYIRAADDGCRAAAARCTCGDYTPGQRGRATETRQRSNRAGGRWGRA